MNSQIKSLPSMVQLPDGQIKEIVMLDQEEQQKISNTIATNIGNKLGMYFTSNPENWKQFLKVMQH